MRLNRVVGKGQKIKSDQKWSEMVRNGWNLSKMLGNSQKWLKMVRRYMRYLGVVYRSGTARTLNSIDRQKSQQSNYFYGNPYLSILCIKGHPSPKDH